MKNKKQDSFKDKPKAPEERKSVALVHKIGESDVPLEVGAKLKSHKDITGMPLFPKGTTSLLSKHLTKEIWLGLKDAVDKNGYSFK